VKEGEIEVLRGVIIRLLSSERFQEKREKVVSLVILLCYLFPFFSCQNRLYLDFC